MTQLNPEVAIALAEFGLITEDQMEDAIVNWEEANRRAYEDAVWWAKTAQIAWENETSWFSRFLWAGVPPSKWSWNWISKRRGW